MSSHADTIRATLEARLWVGQYFKNDPGVPAALNALDEWEAENQRLEEKYELLLGSQQHWRELSERLNAGNQRLEETLQRIARECGNPASRFAREALAGDTE